MAVEEQVHCFLLDVVIQEFESLELLLLYIDFKDCFEVLVEQLQCPHKRPISLFNKLIELALLKHLQVVSFVVFLEHALFLAIFVLFIYFPVMEAPGRRQHIALELGNSSDILQRGRLKPNDLLSLTLILIQVEGDDFDRVVSRHDELELIFINLRLLKQTKEERLTALKDSSRFEGEILARDLGDLLKTHQL